MPVLAAYRYWDARSVLTALPRFFVWGLLMLIAGLDARAQPAIPKEYQVKAVFLFNFAQFVKWPASAFPQSQSPLVIGILGQDPFGAYLDETVRGETINNRPLVVQRYRKLEDIQTCHILFISSSEKEHTDKLMLQLKNRSILTVGDYDGFAREGGIIRFTTEKGKTRLRINLEAAKAANLVISSKLLRPTEIVTSGGR